MEHGISGGESNIPQEEHVGFFRRLARRAMDRLTPPLITPIDLSEYVGNLFDEDNEGATSEHEQFSQEQSPGEVMPITITLDHEGSFFMSSGDSLPIGPLATRYNSTKLFRDLATLYLSSGSGEYMVSDVATRAGYKDSTVSSISERLSGLFPVEVFSVREDGGRKWLTFGDLAFASSLEGRPEPPEAEIGSPLQTPEQINEGKIDLTAQTHAMIDIESLSKERFYLPLQSPAAIMAARVIESIKGLRDGNIKRGVRSSEVAERVWQNMTLAERQIFVEDAEAVLLSNASCEIEVPVVRVLRRLTNRLMLTHEPRGDRFTLLNSGLSIQYSEQPLNEAQVAELDSLRPISPPEQAADEPAQERQAEYMGTARSYMLQAKDRSPVVDEDAIEMLDFLMSPHGHWAVRSVAGEEGLFKTYDGAMYAMHTYLRVHFHGYGPAYRNRLIRGNKRVFRGAGSGGVRQVGGAIPKDSNWVLGHGLQELFGDVVNPEKP